LNAAIAVVLRLFWSELGRWLTLHLVTKPKFCLPLAKMILISTWFLYVAFRSGLQPSLTAPLLGLC